METHARYFLIGIFSLVVTISLVLFVLWLGKLHLDRDYQEYDVRFHESVTGLSIGGLVQYHGIQVGEVRRLSLDANDPREVRVRIRVAADTPVKTDTKAQLSYTGLTGVAVVEMFSGTPKAKLLREVDTRHAPEIDTVPSTLSQLMSGGSGAMHSAQEVMARIAEVLNDENIGRVSALLNNLAAVSNDVKSDYPALREALTGARELEQRLGSAATRADALLAQLQEGVKAKDGQPGTGLVEQARDAVAEIRSAAREVDAFAQAGKSTFGSLDEQARNELTATLQSLQQASDNLVRITQKFDQGPADYVLGGETLPVYTPESNKQ
ncbi:MAG: MCE family protein [Rhodanobacteraceae bacterium]|nr:MCE family protein [Rhodanobacteraceae bacterium]MBK7042544.1 MCE family protein [Rhodanobacteraceae bacterium]MBP9154724.1 MCE family protein [Xanthomonadales bacterium]HQW81079.1 MlaD family protein [Pseudomonadota bacterium]